MYLSHLTSPSRSHLGSVMPAVCLTRPQYVLRSYCDSGSARLPGSEADMFATRLCDLSQSVGIGQDEGRNGNDQLLIDATNTMRF